jgi:hypothetical protein
MILISINYKIGQSEPKFVINSTYSIITVRYFYHYINVLILSSLNLSNGISSITILIASE